MVYSERISQHPPGNIAALGDSPPLWRSLEQPLQLHQRLSLERLIPLVDNLAAWKLLPNVSRWVLQTVERGYRIHFGSPPPRFSGVVPTLVGPQQVLGMEQEVDTLLRNEAIEVVPPLNRESGSTAGTSSFQSRMGGLRPILDLHQLNHSVMRLKFKMLTLKQVVSQIRSEDWFVTIDLKDAYFHISIFPQHRKFLRFAFGGEAYQYRVLPFDLALSPCTFTTWFLSQGPVLGTPGHRVTQTTDASLTGWGTVMSGRSARGLAHQLPGDAGRVSSTTR